MTTQALTTNPLTPDRQDAPLGRPVKAWLGGCAVAALTAWWGQGVYLIADGIAGAGGFLLHLFAGLPGVVALMGLAVFLTSVPAPLLILTERSLHLRRGLADMCLFAALAALLAQLFGWPLLAGPGGIALTALAALCGAMGGLAYWIFAGRPQ